MGEWPDADADEQDLAAAQSREDRPLEDLVVEVERADAKVAEHSGSGHYERSGALQSPIGPHPINCLTRCANDQALDHSDHRIAGSSPLAGDRTAEAR